MMEVPQFTHFNRPISYSLGIRSIFAKTLSASIYNTINLTGLLSPTNCEVMWLDEVKNALNFACPTQNPHSDPKT